MMKAINAIKLPGRLKNNSIGANPAKPQIGSLAQIPAFKRSAQIVIPEGIKMSANAIDKKDSKAPSISESSR